MTIYSGTREFEGATFVRTSFKGATLRSSDVSGVTMRSAGGLDIDSHDLFFGSLIVNGVRSTGRGPSRLSAARYANASVVVPRTVARYTTHTPRRTLP